MAKEVQNSRSGEIKKTTEDLDEFINRARTGAGVSNEEILGFAMLFNDELTLDNISNIKNDDKLIKSEGVESLLEAELRDDCIERDMLGILYVEEMRQQEEEAREEEELAKKKESAGVEEDVALKELLNISKFIVT